MKHKIGLLLTFFSFLFVLGANGQTQKWRDIHKVKKHETIFRIAKNYDITIDELIAANPEMKQKGYELKKGDMIYIPYSGKTVTPNKATASKTKSGIVKVGVMLPILNGNSEGARMIEYYRGVRAALDSLAKEGINTEINLWNLAADSVVTTLLSNHPEAASMDIILGPLYSNQVKPLAEFCHKNNVKLVMPFSITGNEVAVNPTIFQIYEPQHDLDSRAIGAFIERFGKTHKPLFIDCNSSSDGKYAFTSALRKSLSGHGINPDITNVNTPLADFAKHFSASQPNVIVLNTAQSPQLNRVFAKLDSLKAKAPGLSVSMFGYNEWFMYQRHDLDYFFKYNVHIPTTYYYSNTSSKVEALERDYKAKYGSNMNPDCLPRMALLGYDHTMFFVRGLHKYGKDFTGNEKQSQYKAVQSRLNFKRVGNGGYQNQNFQVIRFKADQTIDSLTY